MTTYRTGARTTVWGPQSELPRHITLSEIGHDTSLFRRLVLGCINTDFSNQTRILQHFSKSTKLSNWIFKILQNFAKIRKNLQNFAKFSYFLHFFADFLRKSLIFANFCNILKFQLDSFVDFEKCCKMRIWLLKSVLIQPRTSLLKSDVSWLMCHEPLWVWPFSSAHLPRAALSFCFSLFSSIAQESQTIARQEKTYVWSKSTI